MYITSLKVSQIGSASGHRVTLRVEWEYGDQSSDVIQISIGGVVFNVEVKDKLPTHLDIPAQPAGTQLSVSVFARQTKNGVLLEKMPDDQGEELDFRTFSLTQAIVTVDQPDIAPPPVINDVRLLPATLQRQDNGISISWVKGNYSSYTVLSAVKGTSEKKVRKGGTDNEFTLHPVFAGKTYTFRVRGIGLSTNPSSDFSPITQVLFPGNTSLRQFLINSGVDLHRTVNVRPLAHSTSSLRRLMALN